jgi:Exostosin family
MNIYFISSNETPLAQKETRFLNELEASLISKGCKKATSPSQADVILINEENSFKEWRYIEKLMEDPIVGANIDRVYTINTDDCATGLLKGLYTSIPSNRILPAIYEVVPYAKYPNKEILNSTDDRTDSSPPYLASWRGNLKSNPKLRRELVRTLADRADFKIETTDSWLNHGPDEQKKYVDLLRSSKFSLCPAGWAPISFRIYESMALGVAPVIIADKCVLPAGPDWNSCSIRIRERDIGDAPKILRPLAAEYSLLGRAAQIEWKKYFSPNVMANYYAERLLHCVRNNLNKGCAKDEVTRMRSFHSFWNNNWTLPQRLHRRIKRFILTVSPAR